MAERESEEVSFETIEAWICDRATETQLEAISRDLTSESGSKVHKFLKQLNEKAEKIRGDRADRGETTTVANSLAWMGKINEQISDHKTVIKTESNHNKTTKYGREANEKVMPERLRPRGGEKPKTDEPDTGRGGR